MNERIQTKDSSIAFVRRASNLRVMFVLSLSLFVFLSTHTAPAQDDDEAAARYAAGIIGRYTDDRGMVVEQVDEALGSWADGTPLGVAQDRPFTVVWRGYIFARPEGPFRFHAYFRGSLKLSIDGRQLFNVAHDRAAWAESTGVELEYGWRRLEATFAAPANGAQLVVAWSGPGFAAEPLTAHHLYHDANSKVDDRLNVGTRLLRDLRCAACHQFGQQDWLPRAPSLTHVSGNLDSGWVVQWLMDHDRSGQASMPSFALSRRQAIAIATQLEQTSRKTDAVRSNSGNVDAGKRLFLSVGCLACHQWNAAGATPTRGTVDLTQIADKRSRQFFDVYLHEPSQINADHRMPVFDLNPEERDHLAAFLDSLHGNEGQSQSPDLEDASSGDGQLLIEQFRCTACHQTNRAAIKTPSKTRLTANSDWQHGCLSQPDPRRGRPGYNLTPHERAAIQHTVSMSDAADLVMDNRRGTEVLRANQCLSCHPRGLTRGIESTALSVAQIDPGLASVVPALIPPSLSRAGAKLRRNALQRAIRRDGPRRRPWLKVRMPNYRFEDGQLASLVDALIRADQFPLQSQTPDSPLDTATLEHAGARLVTSAGFGCTSCHAIGGIQPPDAPLNALAPDLAGLGQRVHRNWFDAWVRDPSRIVPRIEMPSITVAVPGVLDQKLDDQLQAVWHVLNQPDFRPPQPNPIRVVRLRGDHAAEQHAVILTDVLQDQDRLFIKPFLVALPNRHNMVFDLERGQLASWSIGDAAFQRTRGKSWFWELAGTQLFRSDDERSDLALVRGDRLQHARACGQFVTRADGWTHLPGGIEFFGKIEFSRDGLPRRMKITQRYVAVDDPTSSGWRRHVTIDGTTAGDELRLRVVPSSSLNDVNGLPDGRAIRFPSGALVRIDSPADARFDRQGYVTTGSPHADNKREFVLHYSTTIPVDRFPSVKTAPSRLEPTPVDVVPGFRGMRLPVSDQMMPTGIDWRADGSMLVTSLKGRVWLLRDSDGDGLEESARPFSDELAAPFGVAAWNDHVDVINKYGLLRMFDEDHDDFAERVITLAEGWGHTDDYHDWAVGLPRGTDGSYFVALSCQQDERTQQAAHLRGRVLRLTPQSTDPQRPLSYAVHEVSAGHRFPIGIALSRNGQLFVTDNQGNYNPYNELNHVRPGVHFGFVNKLESHRQAPPLTPPAVNIPHPWTRSVNGICFLDTPHTSDSAGFGPFEGHLIGCEYDTRRLIRLTLQQVGNTIQGAAYPFSLDDAETSNGRGFLGPLTAAVSPRGELYVGDIRDSGWGGGPNHGAIVRLTPSLAELPPGIAEVKAIENGFEIRFTQPVARQRAADRGNYSISSATRVATPAYGGPDQHRSTASIIDIEVSSDGRRVQLTLDELKAGYVYDFHLKNLTDQPLFHPAVAFYTMNVVPPTPDSVDDS